MTPKQIKFFKKLSVKMAIIVLIITPFSCLLNHWLLDTYGKDLSLFWCLYISIVNGLAIGAFFTLILGYFYDAYLDKQEFINYCREIEGRNQETRG